MGSFRLALISMPWPLANRPSIQLATLKSYLNRHAPEVKVECHHPYLDVANLLGIHTYNSLAERTWVAESVYGYLINPEKRGEILKLWEKESGGSRKSGATLEAIAKSIERLHEGKHLEAPWSTYDLIGFSICLSQLTSSLHLIRKIRRLHPNCRIVVGGSNCAGDLGSSLLAHIPEIDFVASGEGELPLLDLIRRLQRGPPAWEKDCPGLLWRDPSGEIKGDGIQQLSDLRELPIPDYDDFFRDLREQSEMKTLIPALPVESSRGCWWHRARPGSGGRACRFCNLNLQWEGYRRKAPRQVAREVETLASRYGSLRFFFVDNILDPSTTEEMFQRIAALGRSLEIFTEVRASISRRQLLAMRSAGVTQVQIGVESLSSRLLRKLNKGTTVIQNMEIMKHCEQLGIRHHSNLILGFPGSDTDDVTETLENLSFVAPYQPLRKVRFWLGQNSPLALQPERYGIRRIANHPNYSLLLPGALGISLCLMIKSYVGDRSRQQQIWRPVARAVEQWQREYRRRDPLAPLLSFRDGGDFLLIRRRSGGTEQETYRLRGPSRDIYRLCEERQTLAEIHRQFPRFSLDRLQTFISDLVRKRLMFQEGDQVLSLAVNEDPFQAFLYSVSSPKASRPSLDRGGGFLLE
jgi:ribosomal peptide maturation radical SAM protein 1